MFSNLPEMLQKKAGEQGDRPAQYTKDSQGVFQPITFSQLHSQVLALAAALERRGVVKGQNLGLISENRQEWLVTDLGILSLGAVDVPRGNDTTPPELAYILGKTQTRICFVENRTQCEKILGIKDQLPQLQILAMFDFDPDLPAAPGMEILSYQTLLAESPGESLERIPKIIQSIDPRDPATIIFTSGTTGTPKGVVLTHGGFINQVIHVPELISVASKDLWLCVLPVWHSFERVMQYVSIGNGSALAYSKPLGKIMLADMAQVKPTWMASVPRIWEALMDGVLAQVRKQPPIKQGLFHFFVGIGSLWAGLRDLAMGWLPEFHRRNRTLDFLLAVVPWAVLFPLKLLGDKLVFSSIKEKLGGRFQAGISGGGALPPVVDKFFAAAGILLLEGYGITETSPVLGVRKQISPWPGTVGPVFPGMEVQVRNEEGEPLGPGQKGILYARGPQVMLGYYQDPDLTSKAIDSRGWFNTGDLGMLGWNMEIKILGRAKDTIVLRGGENVEPSPIEAKLKESTLITEAVVVGQDQKFLGALVLPSPLAYELNLNKEALRNTLAAEISRLVSKENNFRDFERVIRFYILETAFEIGRELSAKQEIKRHVIQEMYSKEIAKLFE